MTEYEKLQEKTDQIIKDLEYFGVANITHMTDERLRTFFVLVDQWRQISGDELLKRNTERMNQLDKEFEI